MSVFSRDDRNYLEKTLFFDTPVDIARYDVMKYPAFEKLSEKQLSFFWRPSEVDLSKDSNDFKNLSDNEKHIFTSNLKRQILLDSVQGRSPVLAFLPICSNPELENWIVTWTANETIHSKSYTHIIRNVYSNPSVVFDELLDIKEIADCAKDISKYYDDLINITKNWNKHPSEGYWTSSRKHSLLVNPNPVYSKHIYEMKTALWLCLNAVNALEGIRFYASFACSWNFAELKKMEGNAKIIKLIARDENIHLAGTQQLLKLLPKDDPDFVKISEECQPEVTKMFVDVVNQEKGWAKYIFLNGSMIGLNEKLLCDYLEWLANKRMTAIGLTSPYKGGSNPLPWTAKWIAGSEVQVAPQEVELSSYLIGSVKQDVNENTFSGLSL